MEERYQVAARQDMQQALQASSSTLKFLISRNAAALQGNCVLSSETQGLLCNLPVTVLVNLAGFACLSSYIVLV